jgi:hypothetical protein
MAGGFAVSDSRSVAAVAIAEILFSRMRNGSWKEGSLTQSARFSVSPNIPLTRSSRNEVRNPYPPASPYRRREFRTTRPGYVIWSGYFGFGLGPLRASGDLGATYNLNRVHMSSDAKSFEAARRSTRIRAQIPFRLTSLDSSVPFSEQCHTLVVNTEGCGVRLARPLEPGLPVLLDELPGGTSAPAQVANCVPLGTGSNYWLVGIALDQPGNIWCIRPAPENWGELNAAAVAVPLPKKENEWPYSVFSSKGEAHPGRK